MPPTEQSDTDMGQEDEDQVIVETADKAETEANTEMAFSIDSADCPGQFDITQMVAKLDLCMLQKEDGSVKQRPLQHWRAPIGPNKVPVLDHH